MYELIERKSDPKSVLIFQQVSEMQEHKKVVNALPKNPSKRNEIVEILSQKFNLQIV